MIIRLPELKVPREFKKAVDTPKFSLKKVWSVLEAFDLELYELTLSSDQKSLVLCVDMIDLAKRGRLVTRLQKKAVPKSEWKFKRDEALLYGNVSGRIVTSLTFERKK